MKKLFLLIAATLLVLAWGGTASASTPPYFDQTYTSTHSVTDYLGDDITVVVGVTSGLRVDSTFTKNKGRCVKGSTPGVRVVTTDGYFVQSGLQEHLFTPPTQNGAVAQGYVTFALTVAPGTYKITPFYSCAAMSSTRVLLY